MANNYHNGGYQKGGYQNKGGQKNKGDKGILHEDFYNPYSFVPIADTPCFLGADEAARVLYAQDIPFSDGRSGHLDVHFRADSPICVKHDNEAPESVNVQGRYFIPGSSVKGMLRNVLEIISMSNIRRGMADDRYSMRDVGPNSRYTLKPSKNEPTQEPGFLFIVNGDYYVIPSNKAEKVDYKEERLSSLADVLRNGKSKIADKYKAAGNDGIISLGGSRYMWLFSGYMRNKKHEYRLQIPDFRKGTPIPLKGQQLQDFLFIHEEETKSNSWKYWKRILEKKIYRSIEDVISDGCRCIAPCFFRTQNVDGETVVKDLGFAFLYREPYRYRLYDMLHEGYESDDMDLATSIFGFTGKESLKGRVQVQNSFIDNAKVDSQRWFILGGPKPSFCPFYLEQRNPKSCSTYLDKSVISGWKRYLIHGDETPGQAEAVGKKSASSFSPLKKGAEFVVRINYHNLQPYELGALVAAITFNGQKGCHHTLGYAKPFGYGKLTVTGLECSEDVEAMMVAFRKKILSMSGLSCEEWEKYMSPLFQIASGDYKKPKIRYPHLDKDEIGNNCREFVLIKENKKSLKDFSPVNQ